MKLLALLIILFPLALALLATAMTKEDPRPSSVDRDNLTCEEELGVEIRDINGDVACVLRR